jgi:hypothetical protein
MQSTSLVKGKVSALLHGVKLGLNTLNTGYTELSWN